MYIRSVLGLAAISIVASFFLGFRLNLRPTMPGLDSSFVWAFNYAAVEGLSWGKDFISTYGPYGYIVSTVDLGDLALKRIILDILLVCGSGLTAAIFVHKSSSLRLVGKIILALTLIYVMSMQLAEYKWFSLFLLILLLGVNLPLRSGLVVFAIAGMLTGFYLLTKLSLGFGSLMILVVACLLAQRPKAIAYKSVISICSMMISFLISWIVYGSSILDIASYLITGWEITKGYSAAMSLELPYWWTGVVSFMLFLVLVILWILKQGDRRSLLSMILLLASLFIVWKHSIVRQDGHVLNLTFFGVFVIAVLIIHALPATRVRIMVPFIGLLLVLLFAISLSNPIPWKLLANDSIHPIASISAMLKPVVGLKEYRQGLAKISDEGLQKRVLPDSIRVAISDSPVDIYPWEISYVPANNLTWKNRPLPASFSTYTPVLDNMNASFFESTARRPQFLLWHHENGIYSIDGRHLFFDEPRTLRTILNYYDIVMDDSNVSLLRVRKSVRFASPHHIGTVTVPWHTWISVPKVNGLLTAEVSSRPTIAMRLINAVFRQNPIYISLRFVNGVETTYRIVPDNMISGLWINPFPVTVEQLRTLLSDGIAQQVVAIRFSGGFASKPSSYLTVSWVQYNLSKPFPVDVVPSM